MTTIKTTIHTYRFDIRKDADKAAWAELKARLTETHPHIMESHGGESHYRFVADLDGQEINLETTHLFDNQWNTAPIPGRSDKGLRVFDWAKDATGSMYPWWVRQGHYLDQTPEMREIRRNTHKCPYCGKQEPAAKGYVFCPHRRHMGRARQRVAALYRPAEGDSMRGYDQLRRQGITIEAVARYRDHRHGIRTEAEAWREIVADRRQRGIPLSPEERAEHDQAHR